jgi:hypothetical protein
MLEENAGTEYFVRKDGGSVGTAGPFPSHVLGPDEGSFGMQ